MSQQSEFVMHDNPYPDLPRFLRGNHDGDDVASSTIDLIVVVHAAFIVVVPISIIILLYLNCRSVRVVDTNTATTTVDGSGIHVEAGDSPSSPIPSPPSPPTLPSRCLHLLCRTLCCGCIVFSDFVNMWSQERARTNGYDGEYFRRAWDRIEAEKEARKEKPKEREERLKLAFKAGGMVWELEEKHFLPPDVRKTGSIFDKVGTGSIFDKFESLPNALSSPSRCCQNDNVDAKADIDNDVPVDASIQTGSIFDKVEPSPRHNANNTTDADIFASHHPSFTSSTSAPSSFDASVENADDVQQEAALDYNDDSDDDAVVLVEASSLMTMTMPTQMPIMSAQSPPLPSNDSSSSSFKEASHLDVLIGEEASSLERDTSRHQENAVVTGEADGSQTDADFIGIAGRDSSGVGVVVVVRDDVHPSDPDGGTTAEAAVMDSELAAETKASFSQEIDIAAVVASDGGEGCADDDDDEVTASSSVQRPPLTETAAVAATLQVETDRESQSAPQSHVHDDDAPASTVRRLDDGESEGNIDLEAGDDRDIANDDDDTPERTEGSDFATAPIVPAAVAPSSFIVLDMGVNNNDNDNDGESSLQHDSEQREEQTLGESIVPIAPFQMSMSCDDSLASQNYLYLTIPDDNDSATDSGDIDVRSKIPTECAICLCDYEPGDTLVVSSDATSCPHAFHQECIVEWLVKMQVGTPCPMCRQPFVELEEYICPSARCVGGGGGGGNGRMAFDTSRVSLW